MVAAWLGKLHRVLEETIEDLLHMHYIVSWNLTLSFLILEVFCWTFTGERQSSTMRVTYLRALLSQDIGFYDTDSTTGEIVVGISSDTLLVQDAIGEKVSIAFQFCCSWTWNYCELLVLT